MDVALEELAEAEALDPSNPRIYNYYGLVYTMLGENAKAESNFQRALALAPEDSEIRHNWGWYLCSNERPRESIPEFEIALRNPLYRTPEIALTNAGRCSAAFGDIASAESYYRRALARSPSNAPAAYGLALLAFRAGKLDEARGWMKLLAQQPAPAPEALYLGMCIERKAGDRAAETRVHFPAAQPLPGLGRGQSGRHGVVRVSEPLANARADGGAAPGAATAGTLLGAARKAAGLSIDAVAQQLKLAPRQVRSLEEDDYTHLPGRTFVRGFVRNYARLVHLDPDKVVGALPAGTAAPALEAPTLQPTAPTMGELPTTDHSKPGWARWAIPLTLAAVVAAAAVYEWMRPAGVARPAATRDAAMSESPAAPSTPPGTSGTTLPNPLGRGQARDRIRFRRARRSQRIGAGARDPGAARERNKPSPSRSATTRGPRSATATGGSCCRG